ncbi:EamA-like transporter family protein [mine drainage metagenome]|uniref:EamA-like transporter family protein n=1 Tax=mine drainage metagenome TaxID=410659 RepID=A0A1J5QKF2_9ZZZZ
MTSNRRTGLLLALSTAVISGVAVFLNSYGVRAFGSASLYTTAKNVVAAVVLLVVVGLGRRAGAQLTRPVGSRQWLTLGVIGVIGGSVPFLLFFEGLARASSGQSAFIHKTLVVWVAALAVPLLGERLSAAHVVAIVLLVVGQIGLIGGITTALGSGELMILGATMMWAVEVVIAKRLLRGVSSWTVGVARMSIGSVVLIAWAVVRGQAGALVSMTGTQWAWVLLTGVILAAYVGTWFSALARAQAVDVTAVLVLGAIVTAALGAAVQGAVLGPQLVWLLALLVGGAVLSWHMWRSRDLVADATAA